MSDYLKPCKKCAEKSGYKPSFEPAKIKVAISMMWMVAKVKATTELQHEDVQNEGKE
ncbi:MAG: hypothetical protein ACUZ8E_04405 [Candidatus Anammoxibacter sp.]